MLEVIPDSTGDQPVNYRYDLVQLEADALNSYFRFRHNDTVQTRSDFFMGLFNLCYAVADISKDRKHFHDPEIPANDCATYIFERVAISKKLALLPRESYEKFPLQQYVRLSMKRYLINPEMSSKTFLTEEEFSKMANILDYSDNMSSSLFKKGLAKQILDDLCIIYTPEDVFRLYPIARESIINRVHPRHIKIPEIKDFVLVYTTLVRKRFRNGSKIFTDDLKDSNINKMLHTCLSSSFFLTMLLESDIVDNALLTALDIESIIRLIELAGGTTIKIPVKEKLNSLLVSMNIATDMVMNGTEFNDALTKVKSDSHIKCTTNPSLLRLVELAMLAVDLERGDKHSEPTFDMLCSTAKLAAEYTKDLSEKRSNDAITVDKFIQLSANVGKITENIIKLQTFIRRQAEIREKQEKAEEQKLLGELQAGYEPCVMDIQDMDGQTDQIETPEEPEEKTGEIE